MKLKKMKKGFTIVELVIVIAVIGVLTAILVPTFINLTAKANKASDDSLVKNLNTALKMEEAEQGAKNPTMHDAVLDLENEGYKLSQLVTKSKKDLLWNMETNQFELEEGQTGPNYWKICHNLPTDSKGFSVYAADDWSGAKEITVHSGFDAGYRSDFTSISYTRQSTDPAQEVVIRTNSSKTSLLINASKDTVHHYDEVGKVTIEKIDMNCYYEKGQAAYVKVTEGKVVAKDGGKIEVAFAANLDGTKVAITEEAGKVEAGYTVIQPVSDANVQREGGIQLTYSIDGEHAASATQEEINSATNAIEATGELSVASETGIQPAGMDFTAVVKNVGYSSLTEAIDAAQAGDTVSLLKDVVINQKSNDFAINYTTSSTLSVGAALVIGKNLTINGNNHNVSTSSKGSLNKGVSIAIVNNNIKLVLSNINITTGDMSNVYVGENATGVSLVVNNSSLTVTSGYGYSIKTCNGTNNFSLEINSSTVDAWATINTRSSNSIFVIKDSVLTGDNRAAQADTNDYATICIDGDGYNNFPHAGNPGVCGSNNTMTIENTRVSATTQSTNQQTWLCIQLGAKNNVVNVKGGDIHSAAAWNYTETENGLTNTVKIDGVTQTGVLE